MSISARGIRAYFSERRGTAAIEFAIGAPMLLILFIGFVEIGFAAYQSMQVHDAVEAGAVYATQNGWSAAGVSTAVTSATGAVGLSATPAPTEFCGCPGVAGISAISCSLLCPDGNPPGRYVQVNATLSRISIFPGSGLTLPANLTATTVVRIQ